MAVGSASRPSRVSRAAVLGPRARDGRVFLAVPLTMAMKIALESSPQTRPIAVMLGPRSPRHGGAARRLSAADPPPQQREQSLANIGKTPSSASDAISGGGEHVAMLSTSRAGCPHDVDQQRRQSPAWVTQWNVHARGA